MGLQNEVSIASILLLTEATLTELREHEHHEPGGGMGMGELE